MASEPTHIERLAAELGWLAGRMPRARGFGIDRCDEGSISGLFGVQLNAAGVGAGLEVSVGVGNLRPIK